MRKKLAQLACLFVLIPAFAFFLKLKFLSDGDPDRYFHLALSRITYESGSLFLRSLPQVENLGWGELFLDKEFLFHQLTRIGFALGGDKGVVEASFLCSILSLVVFFLFASSRIPVLPAALVTAGVFSSPYLAFRLSLLRPHTLAVLAFILFQIAILSRRPRLTALAAFIFTLSYHAFYIPLAGMFFLFCLSFLEERIESLQWRRIALHGAFGCFAGILVNPYFPGNVVLAVIHARIPSLMQKELSGLNFGEELLPVRADHLLQIFHGPLLVILLGTFLLGFQMRQSDQKRSFSLPFGYLLSAAIFFQTLCFQIARAGEYLVPICGFILILIFEEWKKWWKGLSLCLSLLLVGQIFYLNFKVQEWVSTTGIDTKEETIRAIAAIPKEARGLKVFNCEWDRSPYLLYFRPDLKFVDILDPSFLYFADSAAFKGREEIRNGTSADIYGFVRKAFKADYVLCRDPNVTLHFRSDPGFQQIYPATQSPIQSGHVSTLFKVLDDPVPNYVQKLNVRDLGLMDEQKLTEVRPEPSDASSKELELDKTPFLNLGSLLWKERTSSDSVRIRCAFISPALEEQRRLLGADYLGFGGGQGIKIWLNGKPLFSSRSGFPTSRLIQGLVPLPKSLAATDHIELLVCSSGSSPFWGVAVSLWKEKEIRSRCDKKNQWMKSSSAEREDWAFYGMQAQTCIGPMVAPRPKNFSSKHGGIARDSVKLGTE